MAMAMAKESSTHTLRVLRGAEDGLRGVEGIAWIIGMSHPALTVLSFLRCLHRNDAQPDVVAEAGDGLFGVRLITVVCG